jgi:YD repeat-containing protein
MKLVKDGDLFRLEDRFDRTISFNADNKIGSWEDADGNTLTLTYVGDNLQTVEDAFGRTLTFFYDGDLLDTVTDSTGRSVSYEYDGSERLTGYRDTENKLWSYGYGWGYGWGRAAVTH